MGWYILGIWLSASAGFVVGCVWRSLRYRDSKSLLILGPVEATPEVDD